MTSKERLLTAMRHGVPDRVPVTPDTSNMIPCRLTGKPFWDIYLYQNPPIWLAYIDAVKHFGYDGFHDHQIWVTFPNEIPATPDPNPWYQGIVEKNERRLITRAYRYCDDGSMEWAREVTVYPAYDPPTSGVALWKVGQLDVPDRWEPVEGIKYWPTDESLFTMAYELMGDRGIVGCCCGTSCLIGGVEGVYQYHDDPESIRESSRQMIQASRKRFDNLMSMKIKPDFISCGGSGSLIWQNIDMFRDVSLPIVQAVTSWCREAGILSHIHSCGPEAALVKICAEETELDVIDPLEVPPMGDCDLAELKRLYGKRLCLKGNLHTTKVMLHGGYQDVLDASRKAIEDAKEGGGFILSTGDQCGRDTPDSNIQAMIDAVERYGQY
jgi:uroporphyrinogen decarboxylase